MTNLQELAVFKLVKGRHESAEKGLCAMEAVAWLEGLPHSDHPACTCPVIAAYVRELNDRLPGAQRQRLIPYLPRLVGTVSPEHEWQRTQYLVAQAFGKAWPIVFRIFKMERHAIEFEKVGKEWESGAVALLAALAARAAHADLSGFAAPAALWADTAFADLSYLADQAEAYAIAAHAFPAARAALAFHPKLYQVHFDMLDGVLSIGGPSSGFSKPMDERIAAYRELIEA